VIEVDGKIPMRWWDNEKNFGDLLGPWLAEKMTGKPVVWANKDEPHYLTIGSILSRVSPTSVMWGIGSFGTEGKMRVKGAGTPLAVRGPLTRARFEMFGGKAPRVYGDPALLVADYYHPTIEKQYELGVVLRWSERKRIENLKLDGVLVIDLLTDDIEGTIDAFLSCKRILTTSLHGLIVSDAYGIPNAWLTADTGRGKEHKFWDYLLSVGKERQPVEFDFGDNDLTVDKLVSVFNFDSRPISLDLEPLRASCPFIASSAVIAKAEANALDQSKQSEILRLERQKWWKPNNWRYYMGSGSKSIKSPPNRRSSKSQ